MYGPYKFKFDVWFRTGKFDKECCEIEVELEKPDIEQARKLAKSKIFLSFGTPSLIEGEFSILGSANTKKTAQ